MVSFKVSVFVDEQFFEEETKEDDEVHDKDIPNANKELLFHVLDFVEDDAEDFDWNWQFDGA